MERFIESLFVQVIVLFGLAPTVPVCLQRERANWDIIRKVVQALPDVPIIAAQGSRFHPHP
jgi:hypothetical protein